jgi:hypothetical protein
VFSTLAPRRFREIVPGGIELFDDFLGDNVGIGTVCDVVRLSSLSQRISISSAGFVTVDQFLAIVCGPFDDTGAPLCTSLIILPLEGFFSVSVEASRKTAATKDWHLYETVRGLLGGFRRFPGYRDRGRILQGSRLDRQRTRS